MAHSTDPFDTLGLPAVFALEPARIERAALAQLAQLHPDAGLLDADESDLQAARINAARDTLLFALARAEALLQRRGGPAKEADKSLPAGFLAEMMQTREEAEAAIASGDPAARAMWTTTAMQQRAAYEARAATLFAQPQASASPDAATLRELRTHLNAWRYIERLIEQLDPAYNPGATDIGGKA
jgi:molecular chaperone HscB